MVSSTTSTPSPVARNDHGAGRSHWAPRWNTAPSTAPVRLPRPPITVATNTARLSSAL